MWKRNGIIGLLVPYVLDIPRANLRFKPNGFESE